jgi:UDP-glucose 4-epimerase
MPKIRSIISGGAGFIGSHLAEKLIRKGHEVVIIDNLSTGKLENVPSQAEFFKLDLCENLSQAFAQGADYVFHLGAQINLRNSLKDPLSDAQTNIMGSLNIMNHAVNVGVKRFVFTSTGGAIYSRLAPLPWTEQSATIPESPYGMAKLTVEGYLRLYKGLYGLESTILRLSNVFGPRQNSQGGAGVLSIFINNILNKKDLTIFGDGSITRDFVYVDSVINAIYHVTKNNLSGVFNVSTGEETSILEIAEKIKYEMKNKYNAKTKFSDAVLGEIPYSCLSNKKLQSSMSTDYQNINLDDQIKITVESFLESK